MLFIILVKINFTIALPEGKQTITNALKRLPDHVK